MIRTSRGSEELPVSPGKQTRGHPAGLGCCWRLMSPQVVQEVSAPLSWPGPGSQADSSAFQQSQVCGAQVTAPGKRENCKIVAAKSTPLKMAIIHAPRVGNNSAGRLVRKPLYSWPLLTQGALGCQDSQESAVDPGARGLHGRGCTL